MCIEAGSVQRETFDFGGETSFEEFRGGLEGVWNFIAAAYL